MGDWCTVGFKQNPDWVLSKRVYPLSDEYKETDRMSRL